MLGITISLNERTVEENLEYLNEMKDLGCELVFTSLRIPEEDPKKVKASVEKLGEYIGKNYQSFVVDVSPRAFDMFSVEWMKINHITTLRIDNGISEEKIVELSNAFEIIFNASTLTSKSISKLKSLGFNKEFNAWHNYYPRKNSGLDEEYFKEQNTRLKKEDVMIGAYIPGNSIPRGTMYEWLPTLEKHRKKSPFNSYLEMIYKYKIDNVVFGDYGLTEREKNKFENFINKNVVLVEVKHVKDERVKFIKLQNRIDVAQDAIRCNQLKKEIEETITPYKNAEPRKFGDITLDNTFYGRYMGELQIILRDLDADSRVNIVGQISSEDMNLLPLLKNERLWFEFVEEKV